MWQCEYKIVHKDKTIEAETNTFDSKDQALDWLKTHTVADDHVITDMDTMITVAAHWTNADGDLMLISGIAYKI